MNEIQVLRDYKVVKANDIIQRARFSLSAQEQKIILYIISRIKPFDKELVEQTFNILEFCKVCGLDEDNGANYQYIKKNLKGLRDKSIWIKLPNGTETTVSWLNKVTISKQSGVVKLKFDDDMKPYLLQLSKNFTSFELIYTLAMKSQYSIRFYELLKSYQWMGKIEFDIENLKVLLEAENYINFKDFRKKVLEIALREISTFSDIKITYELKKEGKKFTQITFFIVQKSELSEIYLTHKNIYSIIDPSVPNLYDKYFGNDKATETL